MPTLEEGRDESDQKTIRAAFWDYGRSQHRLHDGLHSSSGDGPETTRVRLHRLHQAFQERLEPEEAQV